MANVASPLSLRIEGSKGAVQPFELVVPLWIVCFENMGGSTEEERFAEQVWYFYMRGSMHDRSVYKKLE